MTSPLAALHAVDFAYGQLQVLFGVDLEIRAGEILGLLGTNGAGKSTVLRVLSGLSPAKHGRVEFQGQDVSRGPAEELVTRGLVMVPGCTAMFTDLTVQESLEIRGRLLPRGTARAGSAGSWTASRGWPSAGIMTYKPASGPKYQCDSTAASAQAPPPALQRQVCIDGVTHVSLATSFVAAQTFLQSAAGGPCGTGAKKYKYMASDRSLLAGDLFTGNFSKRQFDGSLAISNRLGAGRAEPRRV
jgi:ABC-type Fe3+/spermidine/putrescine transport system ATPase subunit